MDHTSICKQLDPLLLAIETLANNARQAKEDNASGMVIALNAIQGLCALGDRIYRNGGLTQPITSEDKGEQS